MNLRFRGSSEQIQSMSGFDMSDSLFESSDIQRQNTIEKMSQLSVSEALLSNGVFSISPKHGAVHGVFTQKDEFGIGRDESQHEVKFGQLIVRSDQRANMPALVAVKPFEGTEPSTLYRELAATNYLNSIGESQNSYLPVGVWRNAEDTLNMITLYEHGVISQDSVFWADRNLHPEALRQERLRTSFKDCIWGIGYLHGAGVVHGDAEAKNLAHDGRQVRFIDLESAQLLPRSDKHHLLNDPDSARRKHQDITTFIETSLQVEENRPEILRALSSKDLALFYRKGFKKGSADAEIVSPRTPASESNEYFDTIVNQITNRLHAQ